jgi:hypothetical protein
MCIKKGGTLETQRDLVAVQYFHASCVIDTILIHMAAIVALAWRNSLSIDMLLTAVSVLVVAQPSSEILEGLLNYPV